MIFVTVGTNEARFDRLVEAAASIDIGEELVVQRGASTVCPENAEVHDFLPFELLVDFVRSSRAVVCHAGVGSIMVALANGKRPIVIPRLRKFGEAVDDHQLVFARRFEAEGLVTLAEPDTLPQVLARSRVSHEITPAPDGALAGELRRFIAQTVGA